MEIADQGALREVLERDAFGDKLRDPDASGDTYRVEDMKPSEQLMSTVNPRRADIVIKAFDEEPYEEEAYDENPEDFSPTQPAASGTLRLHQIGWLRKMKWLAEIARGLQFLHGQRIVYRDLKCDNVLVTQHLEAKLADWGTCVQMKHDSDFAHGRTGTIAFMAPEV
jgi:hypothetical protein